MALWLLAALVAAVVLAERIPTLRYAKLPFLRRYFASDLVYLATGILGLGLAMQSLGRWLGGSLHGASSPAASLPFAAALVLALLLYDAGGYLSHWLLHRFEPLWKLHQVHHSSRRLDWLATFRGHLLEHALRHTLSPLALLVAGFPLAVVALAGALHGGWAVLNHSNLRLELGFLEPVLITPRLHRLHHVTTSSHANLGTVFSCWDRLRGTLLLAPDAPVEPLGVPGGVVAFPQTWLPQLVAPFRSEASKAPA